MKRLEYADIAKALAIFAVVLAHVNLVATPGREWMFVNVCYAFHMPLFFLLGGFFLKPGATTGRDGWKGFLAKNFLTLMVPYFVWGVIYMPFSYTNLARLAYCSWLELKSVGTQTALWFLPAMFFGRIFCEIAFRISQKLGAGPRTGGLVAVPLFLAAGLMLPHHNGAGESGNFWEYDVSLVAAAFLMLGSLLRPLLDRLAVVRLPVQAALAALGAGLFAWGFSVERPLLTPGVDHAVMMCNAVYGPWPWFLANALTGSSAVLFLSMVHARLPVGRKALAFVGANTMGVYLLHKNLFPELKTLLGQGEFLDFGWAVVLTLVTIPLSLAVMHVLTRLAPWLLGRTAGRAAAAAVTDVFSVALCEDVLADDRIDFVESARLLKAVRPVADEKGGAYAEFAAALERARADGVITADESDELVAMLRKLKGI